MAEAQLNYIIGQTDTLLQTLEQSELDTDTLLELSLPDAQLKSITNQYMSQYKASLEMSKKQIELKISMLEKEKVGHWRDHLKEFKRGVSDMGISIVRSEIAPQ